MEQIRKAGDMLIDARASLEDANSRKIEELADIRNSTCSEIFSFFLFFVKPKIHGRIWECVLISPKSTGVCELTGQLYANMLVFVWKPVKKRSKSIHAFHSFCLIFALSHYVHTDFRSSAIHPIHPYK